MLPTRISKIYNPTKKLKNLKSHMIRLKKIKLYKKSSTSILTSRRLNQDPHRCGDTMKLVLIPMESGTRSSVIPSYSQDNKCGRRKQDSEHHPE